MNAAASDATASGATSPDEASSDNMPAPEMPAGGPISPQAEVVSCQEFGTLKSMDSDTPLTVTFINLSDGYRGVVWIDTNGTPVDKGGLNQGESMTVETFKTHAWMITDGPGNCIEMFVPKNDGNTTFEIKAPSPVFGPDQD